MFLKNNQWCFRERRKTEPEKEMLQRKKRAISSKNGDPPPPKGTPDAFRNLGAPAHGVYPSTSQQC